MIAIVLLLSAAVLAYFVLVVSDAAARAAPAGQPAAHAITPDQAPAPPAHQR
jgi:hypothetical protein